MMQSKPIHEMNLSESEAKLEEYYKILHIRNKQTKALNDIIESLNLDSPDLRDCIRILRDRINTLTHTP